MGDINEDNAAPVAVQSSNTLLDQDEGKQSIQLLKETKELADITHLKEAASQDRRVDEAAGTLANVKPDESTPDKPNDGKPANFETVFENAGMDKVNSSTAPLETPPLTLPETLKELSSSKSLDTASKSPEATMKTADSGRLNKLRDHSSNIFPVGTMGCKEDNEVTAMTPRRFLDANEAAKDSIGHIENTPRKMPNTIRSDHSRNPLTGMGLDSSDEMKKSTGAKKKTDGNPVLGLGYEKKLSSSSSTRIPPGGFSNGLW